MKKYKKYLFSDTDYPEYLFDKMENGEITVYQKIKPYEMRNRGIMHFYIRKGKQRKAISEARLLTAINQQTPIDNVRYISNKKSYSHRRKILLVELIKAKIDICQEYTHLSNSVLWDDAMLSILASRDITSDIDVRQLLFKHLKKVENQRRRILQFETVEHKISI